MPWAEETCQFHAMSTVPYFLWSDDDQVSDEELRRLLHSPDPAERSLWAARVMREARFNDVWRFLTLDDVRRDWPLIQPRLGRSRSFWEWLLQGWRDDGLVS